MSDLQKQKLNEIAVNYHQSKDIPDKHIEEMGLHYSLQWILEQIPRGAKILEMGFGDGIVTQGLVEKKFDLTIVEGALSLCQELRSKYSDKDLRIEHALFEEFTPNEKYDVVIASHVLEHVDDPKSILDIISNWLKPQGVLLVIVPNRESIHRQLAVLMGLQPKLDTLSPRDLMVGHQRVYSLPELKGQIIDAGFEVTKEKGFFLKVLPNSMMLGYSEALLKALHDIEDSIPSHLLANIGVVARKK